MNFEVATSQSRVSHKSEPMRFPFAFYYAVIFVSFLPTVLSLLGLDFALSSDMGDAGQVFLNPSEDGYFSISRSIIVSGTLHTLMEWSAVVIAFMTVILAFTHYGVARDKTAPIIGLTLFCCGIMDAFHILASLRTFDTAAANFDLTPFTWAITRSFYVIVLIAGAIVCLNVSSTRINPNNRFVGAVAVIMAIVSGLLIWLMLITESLPQTYFPEELISKPYDALRMILFVVSVPIFWRLYKRVPSYVTASLCIMLIPNIVLEAHMAFGSTALYDEHFNIAHGLKIVSYIVPFLGLSFDYVRSSRVHIDSERKLRNIIESVANGVLFMDDKGQIIEFNPAAEEIFSCTAQHVIGSNIEQLIPALDDITQEVLAIPENKTGLGETREYAGMRLGGDTISLEANFSAIELQGKRYYTGIVRDVSRRKERENELQKTLADLQLSNDDLEKFAYIASHDLKSPLRAIDNLSNWLAEDLDGKLEGASQNHLVMLRSRVKRMENLLDSLLEFTRAGHAVKDGETINCYTLIEEIFDYINVPAEFSCTIDPGFKAIELPRMPIEQVLHNLISNAVKHHNRDDGVVKVTLKSVGDFYEISVIDDGDGIADMYHERIFEMFQTLKRRDEIEGSGMGLALVQKIVHRNGGRVSLVSEEGQGAAFTFTWPKEPLLLL